MREGVLLGKLRTLENMIVDVGNKTNTIANHAQKNIQNIHASVQSLAIYINTQEEYHGKYWFLPIGIYPGKKIFENMYKKNLKKVQDKIVKEQKEYLNKMKEKANEDKEVSDKNERRDDQRVDGVSKTNDSKRDSQVHSDNVRRKEENK